jgi:parallel beta-helix repeat protein
MLLACGGGGPTVEVSAEFQKKFQEQLILAKPGEIVTIPAGTFYLDRTVTLAAKGVTIRGAGMDKSILSFKGQTKGAEGLLVHGDTTTLEDFAVEDTAGDAIKANEVKDLVIRRVRVEWTNGPDEKNGAYGLYPVQSENILIEQSVAIGASDAGIYVGQSKNIIVRDSRAEFNVAGIEIENSNYADVYNNVATNNTGGLLVFDLPNLPVQGGRSIRLFDNKVYGNNTDNFAPEGNIVAGVPAGTGVMVLANDEVEVFNNEIYDHGTFNVLVVSYFTVQKPFDDESFDPWPEAIYIHDNQIRDGGDAPKGLLLKALKLKFGGRFPDIGWDGIVNPDKLVDGQVMPKNRICAQNNGEVRFANFDAANNFKNITTDLSSVDCVPEGLQTSKVVLDHLAER